MAHPTQTTIVTLDTAVNRVTRIQQPSAVWLARIAWVVVLLKSLLLFVSIEVNFYSFAQEICTANCEPFALTPQLVDEMTALGLPISFWGGHIVVLDVLMASLYMVVAILIFLWRSDDWLALIASAMLIMLSGNAALANSHFEGGELMLRLTQLHTILTIYLVLKFVAVFPDGRYINRIGFWLVYGGVAWEIGRRVLFPSAINDSSGHLLAYLLITSTFIGGSVISQIYRYRYISTPVQRQQTKWLVLAGSLCIAGVVFAATSYFVTVPLLAPHFNTLPLNVALRIVYYMALIALPLGMAMSVFRYKVWEADLAIHRSVVLGGVTVILLTLFGLTFLALDNVLGRVFGGNMQLIASLVAIAGVTLAFRPINSRVLQFIDQHIYNFRIDLGEMAQQQRQRAAIIDTRNVGFFTGRTVDGLTFGEVIGKGGMGQVYRAEDDTTRAQRAVKVLAATLITDADAARRFQREIAVACTLDHPRLVPVIESGMIDDTPYLVMPYVLGRNLDQALNQNGRMSVATLTPLLRDIADGLAYLHDRDLIHRDIKPANVIVSPDGRANLTDFGLAKSLQQAGSMTASGLVGTLSYIAPEQIRNTQEHDHRVDIYALGIMCYQLLSGRLPFEGTVGQVVFAHLNQPPPDIRQYLPDLPQAIVYVIERALAKEPDMRFDSVRDFFSVWEGSSQPA